MRSHKDIEDFIKQCYPKGLPLLRRRELKRELLSHILDKADYFILRGKSEEESISEALKEMGNPTVIRQSFSKLYRFERLPALLIFISAVLLTVFSVFGGFYFIGPEAPSWMYPSVYHYFVSTAFIGALIFIQIYAFRKKNAYILLSVTVFLLLSLITSVITSAIFQSFCVGLAITLCALFNVPESASEAIEIAGFSVFAENTVLLLGFVFTYLLMTVLFVWAFTLTVSVFVEPLRRKPRRVLPKRIRKPKSLKIWLVFISVSVILFSVMFYFASREYAFSSEQNGVISSLELRFQARKTENAYKEIYEGMSISDAEKYLKEKGFFKQDVSSDMYEIPHLEPSFSSSDAHIYVSKLSGNTAYYDLNYSSVVILCFDEDKLTSKQVYIFRNRSVLVGINKDEKTSDCFDAFLTLTEGMSRDDVLSLFSREKALTEVMYYDYQSDKEIIKYVSFNNDDLAYARLSLTVAFNEGKLDYAYIDADGYDETYNYDSMSIPSVGF